LPILAILGLCSNFVFCFAAEKEAEKGIVRNDVEMTEHAVEKPSSNSDKMEKKARKEKKGKIRTDKDVVVDEELLDEEQVEEGNSDGSDFWVPPAGARWDFDDGGNDRWAEPSLPGSQSQAKGHTEGEALDGLNEDNEDTEMLDGGYPLTVPGEEEIICQASFNHFACFCRLGPIWYKYIAVFAQGLNAFICCCIVCLSFFV
jgi:hypothetical protein